MPARPVASCGSGQRLPLPFRSIWRISLQRVTWHQIECGHLHVYNRIVSATTFDNWAYQPSVRSPLKPPLVFQKMGVRVQIFPTTHLKD